MEFHWDFLFCFLHDRIFKGNSGKSVAARVLLNRHAAPGHLGNRALLRILSGKVCWGGKARQREQALRKHATAKLETGNLNPLSFFGTAWPATKAQAHNNMCRPSHKCPWVPAWTLGCLTSPRAGEHAQELGHAHKGISNGVPCCDYSTATQSCWKQIIDLAQQGVSDCLVN